MSAEPDLAVAADVAYVVQDGIAYAARVPQGPIRVLDGSGALIWSAIVEGGSLHEVIARTADAAAAPADVIAPDVEAFVEQLVTCGLVTLVDDAAAPPR